MDLGHGSRRRGASDPVYATPGFGTGTAARGVTESAPFRESRVGEHLSQTNLFSRSPLSVKQGIPVFSIDDEFIRNYEQISKDHLDSLAEKGTNPWIPEALWTEMEATTVALIGKYARPGDAILDVGVGLGRMLEQFPQLKRHGMDISHGYLQQSSAKGIDVCFARIEDMPYRADSFDLIVCTDVLEHVLDLNRCCNRILEVLRPGGTLIVRVPVYEDLSRYVDPNFPYEFVHMRRFDEPSLRLLFDRVLQCEVVAITPGGYWPLGDRMKVSLPLARWGSIGFRLFSKIPLLRTVIYKPIVQRLYYPIDMNVVVRKPAGWTAK